MNIDEVLRLPHPPDPDAFRMDYELFRKLFWKYRGLDLELRRQMDYWKATNDTLKKAYDTLDRQGSELEHLYQQLQDDLHVAHQVQDALLPEENTLQIEGYDIALYYKQLNEVGGDYFDIFRLPNGEEAIGVFDISGHGVASSLIMGYLKAQFFEATKRSSDPGKLVTEVNERCLPFFRRIKKYTTVNFVRLGEENLSYVSGGGYGFLVREGHGSRLHRGGVFLGLRPTVFQASRESFRTGDLLALYTDGMVEAKNRQKEDYSNRRLNSVVLSNAHRSVQEILDRCLWDYHHFRQEDSDDILLMLIRRLEGNASVRGSEKQLASLAAGGAEPSDGGPR